MTRNEEPAGGQALRQGGGRRWTVWLLFSVAVFFLTFPALFLGDGQFYLRDFHPFFYPQKLFLAQSLDSGTFPLWQPHLGCGVPFFASLQPGVAYPPSLLFILGTSFQAGLKLFVAFHFLLAFLSAALLARSLLRAALWVCCLTGTAFACGGYLVSSVSQLNNLQSAAWAPLVLVAVLALLRGRPLSGMVFTSLAVACQLLGGGVEVTALTLAAALVLAVLPFERPAGAAVWRGPLLVGGAVLLAAGLTAFQVLPTVEMAGRSIRSGGGLETEEAAAYSLQPENLQNIGAPRRLGDPAAPDYFKSFPGGRVPWLISIYQGAVVLYLALAGLLAGRRMLVLRLALLAAAGAGLLLALGDAFPLTAALFKVIPGAGWFRYPEKFVFLTSLALPLLAALGCRDLYGDPLPPPRLPPLAAELTALLLPLALLGMAGWAGGTRGDASCYAVALPLVLLLLAALTRFLARRKMLGPAIAGLLLAILVAVDLSSAHRPLNSTAPAGFYSSVPAAARVILEQQQPGTAGCRIPPRVRSTLPGCPGGPPVTRRPQATPLDTHLVWRAYLSPNSSGIYGISQVRGSTGMELRHPAHRERLLTAAGLPDKLALLALWGVDYLLMDRDLSFPDELFRVEIQQDLPGQRLYRLTRPLPRLFAVSADAAGRYPRAEALLLTTGEGMAGLVDTLRGDLDRGAGLGEGLRITAWGPQRVAAELEIRRPGMLLAFTEGHDPGWTARVDGHPVALQEGLGGFCLAPLPGAGRHRVELTYRPPGFRPGLAVTAAAVALLLLLSLLAWRQRVDRGRGTT